MERNRKIQMTPKERAAAMAKGEGVDRLPCNPNVANGVARVYGCKISDFNTSARTLADAQIASYRKFGYDGVRVFTDLFPWPEAMGAKVICPEDNTADLLEPAIKNEKDIDRLIPLNPYKDGRLPVHLEAMKYLVDEVGDEVGCSAAIIGPFTFACFLLGIDNTLKACIKNPEIVHKLCKIALESSIAYVDAAMAIGLGPTISEPMSSCTVISPRIFRKFSQPYLKQLVDHIKSNGKGVVMHICGQTSGIWQDIADMGVAGFSIDNVASIVECKKEIGSKCRILGNVDPGTIMYMGSKDQVRLETLKGIRDGYDSPMGYTPMSGCSLPIDTPLENIQEMMDTVADVGYPVNIERVNELINDVEKRLA